MPPIQQSFLSELLSGLNQDVTTVNHFITPLINRDISMIQLPITNNQYSLPQPHDQYYSQAPSQGDYDCDNLQSFNGNFCVGDQVLRDNRQTQMCYRIGADEYNTDGWSINMGNVLCNDNDEECNELIGHCSNKPLCKTISNKCNLKNLQL